jgi:translin
MPADMQDSLDAIDKDLKDMQELREKLIKGTRDAVMLCSKSIVAMHHGQVDEAKQGMDQAKGMLAEFRGYAKSDLYKYIAVSEQELVEAYTLRAVMEGRHLPQMGELQVSGQ